jgi:hypothetical protein
MIHNYSELKRKLQVGTELELIYAKVEGHKYLNSIRKIDKVQTNGVKFEGGSWLGLGMYGEKASDFGYTENGFYILEDGEKLLEYKFI